MKGQQQVLSTILLTGILVGVVGSVYLWGMPLIQKNKDVSTLENSESFMRSLDEKIKYIANNGGKDQIRVTVPGTISFDGNMIKLSVETNGVVYASGGDIPLSRNECSRAFGQWGINDPDVLCVNSQKFGDNNYKSTYSLYFVQLDTTAGGKSYKIDLYGTSSAAGENHDLTIENTGSRESGNLIYTQVKISII